MNQAEASLSHDFDPSTKVSIAVYVEDVANAALTATGDTGAYSTSEMMPDLFTNSSVFNIGGYQRRGLMASIERRIVESWAANVSFGNSGTLQPRGELIETGDPESLRGALRHTQRNWANLRITGTLPGAGTRVAGSYMLTDYRAALPAHRT